MASTSLRFSGERAASTGWRSAAPELLFAAGGAVYLLLAAASYLVFRPTTFLYFADYWEHRAIVEEVIRDGIHLRDPIYGEAAPSRQFTPWSLALGYLARVAHIDSDQALAVGAVLVSLLFVAGVYDFGRAFFRRRWAPALLLLVLTCFWGVLPLIWTGFYSLRSQVHGNYYPASLVFALTFLAWAQVSRSLRTARLEPGGAAWLGAIVLFSVITHQLNAAILIAGAIGLVLFEPGVDRRRRAGLTLVVALSASASVVWPYYNPLSVAGAGIARGQENFNNLPFFFSPFFVVWMMWPALLGLFAAAGLIRDRRSRLLVAGFVAVSYAYCLGGWADISISHRFLAYVALALHLIIVQAVLNRRDSRKPLAVRDVAGAAGAAALAALQVALAIEQLLRPWAHTFYPYPIHPVAAETRVARETLPPDARLIGWDSAALVVPAFGIQVAAYPRPMVFSLTDAERQADYRRFFSAGVPEAERRAIADRWGATHVAFLTNELAPGVQDELAQLGEVRTPVEPWRIIPLRRP